jgi:hypothetical protein
MDSDDSDSDTADTPTLVFCSKADEDGIVAIGHLPLVKAMANGKLDVLRLSKSLTSHSDLKTLAAYREYDGTIQVRVGYTLGMPVI